MAPLKGQRPPKGKLKDKDCFVVDVVLLFTWTNTQSRSYPVGCGCGTFSVGVITHIEK